MDVGPVSTQSAYRYPQAQSPADGRDPLAALAAASAISSQGGGANAAAQAAKPTGPENPPTSVNGVEIPSSYRGMDASSAAALLASLNGDGGGTQGFEAALSGGSVVALAAYQMQLVLPANHPDVSAAAATPSLAPPASVAAPAVNRVSTTTGQDPASPGAVQQAVQAALNPGNLSLFA